MQWSFERGLVRGFFWTSCHRLVLLSSLSCWQLILKKRLIWSLVHDSLFLHLFSSIVTQIRDHVRALCIKYNMQALNLFDATWIVLSTSQSVHVSLPFLGLWTSLDRSLVIPWNRGSRKDSYQETLWLDLYCCCCWNLCILWVFDSPEFTRMHLLVPIDTRAMKQPVQKPIFYIMT